MALRRAGSWVEFEHRCGSELPRSSAAFADASTRGTAVKYPNRKWPSPIACLVMFLTLSAAPAVQAQQPHDFVVVAAGETVSQIVERLAPTSRSAYQGAFAAILALNQARFPGGRVERVAPGFQLWVPASLLSGTHQGGSLASAPGAAIHTTQLAATLAEVAATLFPDSAGAAENALADLIAMNAGALTTGQRKSITSVPKGTRLRLAPWILTALTTPLSLDHVGTRLRGETAMGSSASEQTATAPVVVRPAAQSATLSAATPSAPRPPNEERQVAALAPPTPGPNPISRGVPAMPISDATGVADIGETVIAQVTTLDRVQAEEERLRKQMQGKPKAYEDKVMDASTLPAQRNDSTEEAPQNATGFRSYLVETRAGFANGTGSASATEFGVRTEYRHETLNHGEYVAQVDVRTRQGDATASIGLLSAAADKTSARVTLRNLGFPITTQLFADTTLGDQLVQVTDAFGRAYRLSLGSGTVRGVSTHLFSRQIDVRAGIGERGVLAGGPYPGFERTSGALAWLGATQRFGTNAFFGAQLTHADGLQDYSARGLSGKFAATSGAVAIGYGTDLVDPGSSKARMTVVASNRSAGADKNGFGVFTEAGMRVGGYRHEFGAYWAQPGLMFGDTTLASDNRGAYWRVDRHAGRLFWGMGVDYEDTNPGNKADRLAQRRFGINGNAQYRIDRDSSIGGSANASDVKYLNGAVYPVTGDGTRSYNASLFYQTRFVDWGRSRFTATVRHNQTLVANDVAASGQELQWEHDWVTGKFETMRPELVTTLGYARDTSGGQVQSYPTAGVQWKYWWDADWSLGGNLRYTSRTGNLATSRGLSGGLTSEKIFNNGWRVGLQASINEARVDTTGPIVSTTRSNSKSVFVYVRWEASTGQPYSTLGLRTAGSAGSGAVTGIVYFDANRDGAQQADERGVPNVEVVLDGRYRVTTDRDGRFEFPLVPTGQHRITLVLESVPLPWGAALERGLGVDVPLRGQAIANIPVVKVGE